MSFDLDIELKRTERAFERLLGVVGRRGYELVSVSANSSVDRGSMRVQMTLSSQRSGEPLVHHLAKLYEVEKVNLTPAAQPTVRAVGA
jgi:acetolactate synthase regulatory subunit